MGAPGGGGEGRVRGVAYSGNIPTFSPFFIRAFFFRRLPSLGPTSDETIPFFNNKNGHNKNAKTRENSRMHNTIDYKNNLCYEYDQLVHYSPGNSVQLTPEQYHVYHQQRPAKDCTDLEQAKNGFCVQCCQAIGPNKNQQHCEDICKNANGEPSKATFAAVVPKQAQTGLNRFTICQKDTCVEAGRLGTFGRGSESSNDYRLPPTGQWLRPSLIDDGYYRLQEADVTAVIAKQGWSLTEPFMVKMMDGGTDWGKLPDPVFIEKRLGKDVLRIQLGQFNLKLN